MFPGRRVPEHLLLTPPRHCAGGSTVAVSETWRLQNADEVHQIVEKLPPRRCSCVGCIDVEAELSETPRGGGNGVLNVVALPASMKKSSRRSVG